MIFVSLGTMDMPFYRMAEAVDRFAAHTEEDIVVQTGYTDYRYKNVKAFKFCTKPEMQEYMRKADILIMQGGWGGISEAMDLKKRIVVMPRHNKIEHIHDQFQLIRKLDKIGCVIGVFDNDDLGEKVTIAKTFKFNYIPKGNAEIFIREKLLEWFGACSKKH